MKTKQIKITEFQKIKDFVNETSKVDGEVIVRSGKFVVDGKSIMGVNSLALHLGVIVEYPEDATTFEEFLNANF